MRELDYSVSVTVGLLTLEKIINVVGGGQEVGAQENKYLASFRGKLGTTSHIVVGDERIKSRAWEGRKTLRVWRQDSHSLGGGHGWVHRRHGQVQPQHGCGHQEVCEGSGQF